MKFKSALVTQASGSIGGMTGSRNRSGMYFRARSMPVNPQTAFQTVVRDAVTQLSTRWGDLTPEQRENWAVYAQNVPWLNALGDSIRLTGNQMYIGSNSPRIQAILPIIDDAPTLFSVPSIVNPSVSQAGTTPFAVKFNWDNTGLSPSDHVLVYASIAKSPSINFFKGPYRFNAITTGASLNVELTPNPSWVEGQKIFVRAQLTMEDGRLSSSWRGSFILTETPV